MYVCTYVSYIHIYGQAIIDLHIHIHTYIHLQIYTYIYIRQAIIDDASDQSPLAKDLRLMLKLTQMLRAKRVARGALSLASPEVCARAHTHPHPHIL